MEMGFWIKEYRELCGVGDLRDVEYLAEVAEDGPLELEEAINRMPLGLVVDLALPGAGLTRVERVRSAWQAARLARDRGGLPRIVRVRERAGLPVEGSKPLGTFSAGEFG
jgi:hypothetical protein